MRRAISVATSATIIAALIALATTTVVAVSAMQRANDRVTETRALATRFVDLRSGLAEEAFAEAGYRRAPSEESWRRLEAAAAAVPGLIEAARTDVGPVDDATLTRLAILNARYVQQVRETRDPATTSGDDRVAGPALDTMNALLEATISRHREAITEATAQQADLIDTLRLALPIVFAFTFGALAWALQLSRREQRRLHQEAAAQRARALSDPLTGLPNRAALIEAVAAAPDGALLLMIDLDGFKPVNDTWGHPVGDAVLTQAAHRLSALIPAGALAARLGGDEFAVLDPTGRAEELGDQIVRALRAPYDVDGRDIRLSASVGAARRASRMDADDLVREADASLYRAKAAGRDRAEAPTGVEATARQMA